MKLVKLTVKNFRAIGEGDASRGVEVLLDSNNIIFLVGKNNVGKSSILEAYDYFFNDKAAREDDFHGKSSIPIEIEVLLEAEEKDEEIIKQLELDLDENRILKVRKIWKSDEGNKPSKSIWNHDKWQEVSEKIVKKLDEKLKAELPTPIWIRGMTNSQEVIAELRKLVRQTILEDLKQTDEYKKAELAVRSLQKLVQNSNSSTLLEDSLNGTIQKVFPKISISINNQGGDLDLLKIIEEYTQVQAVEKGRPDINLEWQGHGVRRQFILSAYKNCHALLGTKYKGKKTEIHLGNLDTTLDENSIKIKTKILLVEEPELFLHPGAVRLIQ